MPLKKQNLLILCAVLMAALFWGSSASPLMAKSANCRQYKDFIKRQNCLRSQAQSMQKNLTTSKVYGRYQQNKSLSKSYLQTQKAKRDRYEKFKAKQRKRRY